MTEHRTDSFAAIRSSFPGTKRGPYLDVAARGLFYEGGRSALEDHLRDAQDGAIDKKALFAKVEHTRELFASLIGSTPGEVAFTRNVTDGIAAVASSLDWRAGDSVVLCEELEHPANIYPWHGVSRKFGVKVKNVPQSGGTVSLRSILDNTDSSCRAVAVSAVSFAPGFCFPIAELGAECRKRGVLLIVDAAQSIGVVATDVARWHVDVLAASTQKGLMSLYGMGLLYVRGDLAQTISPIYLSRFGVEHLGHEASLGDPVAARLAAGTRRFDVGNYNFPAAIAVWPRPFDCFLISVRVPFRITCSGSPPTSRIACWISVFPCTGDLQVRIAAISLPSARGWATITMRPAISRWRSSTSTSRPRVFD
jgi:cysteine desulfurase / selenocysteine lyase